MQTIYLDISEKRLVPVLNAKQGDRGRKFKAVITNNGVAYPITNETFSAWYDGESGSGNYTTIDGKSAFTKDGNSVVVELAPNMFQTPGESLFCLTMKSSTGEEIGLWNITVSTESIPGFLSDPIGDYYPSYSGVMYIPQILTALQQSQARKNIGAANVDEVPGYKGIQDSEKFNRLTANLGQGIYIVHRRDYDDLPGTDGAESGFALLVFWYSTNYNIQIAYSIDSSKVEYRIVNANTGEVYGDDWREPNADKLLPMGVLPDSTDYNGLLSNLVQNGVYGISAAEWSDWPLATSGPLFVFSFNDNYVIQTAASIEGGEVQTRIVNKKTNAVYRDWFAVGTSWIKVNATDYENKMSNLTRDGAYFVDKAEWTDNPSSESGALLVFRYTTNYVLQIHIPIHSGSISTRIVHRTDKTVFRDWSGAGADSVKILCVGDSIARGYRNDGKGFVGDLGFPYKNAAVSGATISNKNTQYTNIPDQLTGVTDYDPDVIIANGGINDYTQSAPLGDIPTTFVKTDEEAELLNRDTVLGALEYLFYKMVSLYPRAQRYFLLIHKVTRENGVDCTTTKNSAGYTQTELFDAIRKICLMYNVKIIDVFNKSVINTAYEEYRSPVSYEDDNTVTDREFVDKDGVHPLSYGYLNGYLPVVKQALQGGGEPGTADTNKYVACTPQDLTDDEKEQARDNIDAASKDDINNINRYIGLNSPYEYIWTSPSYDQEVNGNAGEKYYFKLNELSDPNASAKGLYLVAADGTTKLILQANEISVGTEHSFVAPIDFVKIRLYLSYSTNPENNKVSFYFYSSSTGGESLIATIEKTNKDLAETTEKANKNAQNINNIVQYVGFNNTYEYIWSTAQHDELVAGNAGEKYYFKLKELSDPNTIARGLYLIGEDGSNKLIFQADEIVAGKELSFVSPIDFVKIMVYLGYSTKPENNKVSFSFGSNISDFKSLSSAIEKVNSVLPVNYLSGIQKPLIIGDSLSAGHCYNGGVEGVNNITKLSCSWHNQLFGKELNTPTSYIGRSGARAIDVLNEFGEELSNISNYDTIIVFLGTNKEADNIGTADDIVADYADDPTETSIGRYSKLLKTIDHYASPYSLKIACGLVPSKYTDRSEYIKLTADTIGGWGFADLNEYEYLFKRLADNHDGTHFTPIGYAEYAGIMKLALNKTILNNPELTKYTVNVDVEE